MTLVDKLKLRARSNPQRIVLPEGEDPRVVAASAAVTREGFAKVTLLGRKQIIESVAADLRVPLAGIAVQPFVNPATGTLLVASQKIVQPCAVGNGGGGGSPPPVQFSEVAFTSLATTGRPALM